MIRIGWSSSVSVVNSLLRLGDKRTAVRRGHPVVGRHDGGDSRGKTSTELGHPTVGEAHKHWHPIGSTPLLCHPHRPEMPERSGYKDMTKVVDRSTPYCCYYYIRRRKGRQVATGDVMTEPRFTDRELDVTDASWRRRIDTVAEVHEDLEDALGYTTVRGCS